MFVPVYAKQNMVTAFIHSHLPKIFLNCTVIQHFPIDLPLFYTLIYQKYNGPGTKLSVLEYLMKNPNVYNLGMARTIPTCL